VSFLPLVTVLNISDEANLQVCRYYPVIAGGRIFRLQLDLYGPGWVIWVDCTNIHCVQNVHTLDPIQNLVILRNTYTVPIALTAYSTGILHLCPHTAQTVSSGSLSRSPWTNFNLALILSAKPAGWPSSSEYSSFTHDLI
jgi:hypothetical protein